MVVVDDLFYAMEKELLAKYKKWSQVPEDDPTLIKIRVIYAGWSIADHNQNFKKTENTKLSHIKIYDPEKKISVVDTKKLRGIINDKNIDRKELNESVGLDIFLGEKRQDKEKTIFVLNKLGVDYDSVVVSEEFSKRQPQLYFDSEAVRKHIEDEKYIIFDLEKHFGLKRSYISNFLKFNKGPKHIVLSLCEMAGIEPGEEA